MRASPCIRSVHAAGIGRSLYLNNPAQPTFFLQTPKEVTTIWQMDQQVRQSTSMYRFGESQRLEESVGHYEATRSCRHDRPDTRTFLDNFRTPQRQLHSWSAIAGR